MRRCCGHWSGCACRPAAPTNAPSPPSAACARRMARRRCRCRTFKRIIREQFFMLLVDEAQALATLPQLAAGRSREACGSLRADPLRGGGDGRHPRTRGGAAGGCRAHLPRRARSGRRRQQGAPAPPVRIGHRVNGHAGAGRSRRTAAWRGPFLQAAWPPSATTRTDGGNRPHLRPLSRRQVSHRRAPLCRQRAPARH